MRDLGRLHHFPLESTGEWTPFVMKTPPYGALVRFWNEVDGRQWTGTVNELSAWFNVAYLWWKLTGIERMRRG